MADNSFRTFRRDGPARDARSSPRDAMDDPLAELARLIGQSEPPRGSGRSAPRQADAYDGRSAPAPLDWGAADAVDEDYAQPGHPQANSAPRLSESYPSQAADDAWQEDNEYEDETADARQYARDPGGDPYGDAQHDADMDDSGYRAEPQPQHVRAEQRAFIPPGQARSPAADGESEDDGRGQYGGEAPATRRSGTIVIVAMLGLAVLGTAGALGYRAMFGGSVIPSLPPIIKPGDSPIKIVPKHESQTGTPDQTDAAANGTQDQLVTHEEQPVNVQSIDPAPHMVTTIPVISNAPDAPLPDGQSPSALALAPAGPALSAPAASNPGQPLASSPDQLSGPAVARGPDARAVHTLTIMRQQESAAAQTAAPSRPVSQARTRQSAVRPSRQPPEYTASAGPLSIVPATERGAPGVRPAAPRGTGAIALASPTQSAAETAPARGGGYAVQVSSQRSEVEAEAAFRSLQAKYPQQLGGRHVLVRRADLGAKGIYYRALVGPFASAQEAASLCSSLKAAGGNCLLQRD